MARPIIFVSSTYYDLAPIRESLGNLIHSIGYDAVLSERGKIAYLNGINLDESCYLAVKKANIFVLIIGGRYGSESSLKNKKDVFENNRSVTMREFDAALLENIPVYVLVSKSVANEYHTYLVNKDDELKVKFAHVDNEAIFEFYHYVKQKRTIPIYEFNDFSEIGVWLKEQWAGLLAHFLSEKRLLQEKEELENKIKYQNELNTVIKGYLEFLIKKDGKEEGSILIKEWNDKLKQTELVQEVVNRSNLMRYFSRRYNISDRDLLDKVSFSDNIIEFLEILDISKEEKRSIRGLMENKNSQDDFKEIKNEIISLNLTS